jgi:hypothetical protein
MVTFLHLVAKWLHFCLKKCLHKFVGRGIIIKKEQPQSGWPELEGISNCKYRLP